MAENVLKALSKKTFDMFENLNFYAENVVISADAISSVNTTDLNSNIYDFGGSTTPPLIGFTTYKEYSIFVFEQKVLIFQGTTKVFENDPSFVIVDFCQWYTWLLCWAADGTFFYVNFESLVTFGENSTLKTDTNFLPVGETLFSVTNHMNFICFSRTDGYLLWTKALIIVAPSTWAVWTDIGWSANYFYVGEPLHLGSYSSILGVNYNVYQISFTKIEDSLGLTANKIYSAFGADKNICFASNAAYIFTSNGVREYTPRSEATKTSPFSETKMLFSNVQVTPPCKRIYSPTFLVQSILGNVNDFYVHMSDTTKLFMNTYLFNNGDDFYCIIPTDQVFSGKMWASIYLYEWGDLDPVTTAWDDIFHNNCMAYFKFAGASDTKDTPLIGNLSFLDHGSVVQFEYDKFPTEIQVKKTSIIGTSTYLESATIKSSTYPYAVFRGRGNDEYFEFTFNGSYTIRSIMIGDPGEQSAQSASQ